MELKGNKSQWKNFSYLWKYFSTDGWFLELIVDTSVQCEWIYIRGISVTYLQVNIFPRQKQAGNSGNLIKTKHGGVLIEKRSKLSECFHF